MPKGRGSNKRRGRLQKDSDRYIEGLARGALKLQQLGVRAGLVAAQRRKGSETAKRVAAIRKASEKAAERRRRVRADW